MADIGKINAVALANIAKVDAVAAAAIAKINGLVFTAAAPGAFLLDTYPGAAAAYSVRKLDKDYTGSCMRIREDSGDTETDIGFDGNGDLDTAAIATHCGTANGYVVTWYDQSGNANNADQATDTSQAQIYNGTAVITENAKPALNFDDVGNYATGNIVTDDITVSIVCTAVNTPTTVGGLFSVQAGINQGYELIYVTQDNVSWRVTTSDLDSTLTENSQSVVFASYDGTTQQIAVNGTNTTQSSSQTLTLSSNLEIGTRRSSATSQFWGGTIQEVIVYANDTYADTTNRNAIESNVTTYFSIT